MQQRLTKEQMLCRANCGLSRLCGSCTNGVGALLLAAVLTMLSACGGSSSSGSQSSATLSGNWQFSMTNPDPTVGQPGGYPATALYGLQGGFLLQNNGSVAGQAVYSISGKTNNQWSICDSGSAPITGTINGQAVNLTANAGSQTFALQGTLGSNGQITNATFTTPGGNATGFESCGAPTPSGGTGLSWGATSVPPITGTITGSFHSAAIGNPIIDTNQDFPVTGSFTQGENIGASSATVTGTLSFLDAVTGLSDYPCIPSGLVSVNGQISGNTVILQLIGIDGSNNGQIGIAEAANGFDPVTFNATQNGYVLQSLGLAYTVNTKACPSNGSVNEEDVGYICLALNSATACQQPITLSPAFLTFPAQMLGTTATAQTITLTNNSASALNNLTATFVNVYDNQFEGKSDFNGLPSYTSTDTCGSGGVASNGQPFSLNATQSCTITVSFSPQESCPWLPFPASSPSIDGAAPEWCPFPQSAEVIVNSPASADNDKSFTVPVTGLGVSAIVPSVPELDFGAEQQPTLSGTGGEASLPQMVSFTNNSENPLQILGSVPCTNHSASSHNTLPSPRLSSSPVAGLQVVSNDVYTILPDVDTTPASITYRCDSDPQSLLPNFQISADTCTGTVLAPQTSCSLQIAYVPQPTTNIGNGLDYFLELNTVQCYGAVTSDCEIDSGRFPVELKSNAASPLRMSPGAGLDFGIQTVGKSSAQQQITLLNDPTVANPQTVTFVGKILVQGNYSETDDCPVTLTPGSSCTLTVQFKPGAVGFLPGSLTINYSPEPSGFPQFVYLRGTGQ